MNLFDLDFEREQTITYCLKSKLYAGFIDGIMPNISGGVSSLLPYLYELNENNELVLPIYANPLTFNLCIKEKNILRFLKALKVHYRGRKLKKDVELIDELLFKYNCKALVK